MSTPYDPARLRAQRFERLAHQSLHPVGADSNSGVWGPIRQILQHRQMLDLLIRRDLKSRYKDSSLGFLWTLIRPLTQLVIYYVVMGQFLGAAKGIPDFAIYVFAGLTIYGLFSEIVLGGVNSVVGNAGLVKKIYLPREVFPLASVGSAIFNFAIQLGVLIVATLILGAPPLHGEILYALPATLLILVYGIAFALLLSAVNVYLRDTQYLTEVIMMFLMWASPIVYGWSMAEDIIGEGPLLELYTNNPITLAVLAFHRAFWTAGDSADYPSDLLLRIGIATLIGLVLVYAFHLVFRRLQGNFAQGALTAVHRSMNTNDLEERPAIVEMTDVSKRFVVRKDNSLKERLVTLGRAGRQFREEFWALSGVSTTIRAGETVALIGHNGSGKSTLLKLIGGILEPTAGHILGRGRVAALLELGAGFHPDLTGRENVFLNASVLGLSRDETEDKFASIVEFAGIGDFIDTQVKFYSSGMYVRLAFAVAVHTDPDVLIVDEVLAVGDEAFQRKCMDKIRAFQAEGRTIILVTHSMAQVAELCSRAILLDHGNVIVDGDTNTAIVAFRELLEEQRLEALRKAPPAAEDSQNATIIQTTVRGLGAEPDVIAPGDTIVIETTVSHPTGMDNWLVAFQIDSESGQVVFGTGSNHAPSPPGPLVGPRTVRVELPDVRIGGGKYFVSIALLDEVGRRVAAAPQTASFTVRSRPDSWGSVAIASSIRFVDGEQSGRADHR